MEVDDADDDDVDQSDAAGRTVVKRKRLKANVRAFIDEGTKLLRSH